MPAIFADKMKLFGIPLSAKERAGCIITCGIKRKKPGIEAGLANAKTAVSEPSCADLKH